MSERAKIYVDRHERIVSVLACAVGEGERDYAALERALAELTPPDEKRAHRKQLRNWRLRLEDDATGTRWGTPVGYWGPMLALARAYDLEWPARVEDFVPDAAEWER